MLLKTSYKRMMKDSIRKNKGNKKRIKDIFSLIKERIKYFSMILIMEVIVFLFILLMMIFSIFELSEMAFTFLILELLIGQVWLNYISLKEKLLVHEYTKVGKEFNKEYYELYWQTNIMRIKAFVIFEYISFAIYSSIWGFKVQKVNEWLFKSAIEGVMVFFFAFFIWIVYMIWLLNMKYNKKFERLMIKKKEDFTSYSEEEKRILES